TSEDVDRGATSYAKRTRESHPPALRRYDLVATSRRDRHLRTADAHRPSRCLGKRAEDLVGAIAGLHLLRTRYHNILRTGDGVAVGARHRGIRARLVELGDRGLDGIESGAAHDRRLTPVDDVVEVSDDVRAMIGLVLLGNVAADELLL